MFHLYADDPQLYLTCPRPITSDALKLTLSQRKTFINKIPLWMPANVLKLNDSKTEFLVLQLKNMTYLDHPNIHIGKDL